MAFQLETYKAPDFTLPALQNAPGARLAPAPLDGVAPENYHATSIYPEYFKLENGWRLAEDSRMDCVAVVEDGEVYVREFRHLKAGDMVVLGRTEDGGEGIYVHTGGFAGGDAGGESFAFRQGRSRETAYSKDYDSLYDLLRHEREKGYIVWVLGPACTFDADSRNAFAALVKGGYAHALLAGNALATHDLEGSYKNSALGQDIYTQHSYENGHYNHIDTINRVRQYGSVKAFVQGEGIRDGIMAACVERAVPYVLTGSIRDDGPLPDVYADVYAGQDAMRAHVRKATTIVCLATTLHAIATGNMAPSYRVLPGGAVRQVYFYTVDISEFSVNKLGDRGSLSAKTIVTNVQDFVVNVAKGLGCL